MAKPTYKDAALMLQLAQWASASGLNQASNWMWSDEFIPDYAQFREKYPLGSEGTLKASEICGYFETLGTLWKHGLLNEDLLFDWIAVSMVWNRIKDYALGVREQSGNPRLYENFQALAEADDAYQSRPAKKAKKGKKNKNPSQ